MGLLESTFSNALALRSRLAEIQHGSGDFANVITAYPVP